MELLSLRSSWLSMPRMECRRELASGCQDAQVMLRCFIVAERIPGVPVLVLQNRSDEIQGTRILRLSEPEDRFFAHDGVAILARLFDEQRDAFLAGHLAQREDCLFLYISIWIVFDCVSDRARCFVSRFLRQPEQGVLADVMPAI